MKARSPECHECSDILKLYTCIFYISIGWLKHFTWKLTSFKSMMHIYMFTQITWWRLHHHSTVALWYASYLSAFTKLNWNWLWNPGNLNSSFMKLKFLPALKLLHALPSHVDVRQVGAIGFTINQPTKQASKRTKSRCWSDPTNTSDTQHLQSLVTLNNQQRHWLPNQLQPLTINQKKHQHFQACIVWDG